MQKLGGGGEVRGFGCGVEVGGGSKWMRGMREVGCGGGMSGRGQVPVSSL